MNRQKTFFDDEHEADMSAKARATDPHTSHIAAEEVEASGKAGCQRRLCLECVRWRPGQTAAEIAYALVIERHIPIRRLPELRQAGLVTNGEARRCEQMDSQSMTWWPT